MDKKVLSIVSYIGLLGWLIAFFMYKGQEKNSLASYHLRQSFGFMIFSLIAGVIAGILVSILASISPMIGTIVYGVFGLGMLFIWIMGIVNAVKEEEKPLPLVGNFFEGKFNFIP